MATDVPGILIVDDNEDNRYTLQLMLESDGHERITCAAGGNEAIALIKKEKFSLVLLDLMMPDLNGDEVLKTIKSDPDQRDMPVVMISADTNAAKGPSPLTMSHISRSRSYFINGVDATRTWASPSAMSGRSSFQSPSLRHYDSFS